VDGAEPADKGPTGLSFLAGRSNLMLRVVSSLVLAPLALGAAYLGDALFAAFWSVAALIVLWEWDTLVCAHDRNAVLAVGAAALIGGSLLLELDRAGIGVALILLGACGVAVLASRIRRLWCAAGLFYASALLVAPVMLRSDSRFGFASMAFLFVIVWLTDITAYFVGRAVGGPKLLPHISPNKTWSGAIGGTLAGMLGGVVVASQFGIRSLVAIAVIGSLLSAVSQAGDLFESAIKRKFNAKDASQLLPGHGGLMDRLDGFVAAAVAALLIGLAHGGLGAPSRGLMVW
jgi:phosphatidate cytidylyltransferase